MAVPSSGSLSMLDMAHEALYATYGTGSVTGPISMYDMMNGGNTNGSGNSYPSINTACTPNPEQSLANSTTITLYNSNYQNGTAGYMSGSTLTTGMTIYTNPCGGITIGSGNYWVEGANTCLDDSGCTYIAVNSSGVVTAINCGCP